MELPGYIASVLIGISLGIIGGGGSILTVPLLVYAFGIDAMQATAYSLFIVGVTSAAGAVPYFRKGLVNVKTAIVFGIPSIAAVFLTRACLVPAIPREIWQMGDYTVTSSSLLMVVFALLMAGASYSMIRKERPVVAGAALKQQFNYPLILLQGLMAGTLTGLVGAGGGFLIIPALVVLSKLPMKEAVGTSLVIIAVNSLIGFLGKGGGAQLNWGFLLLITAFAIAGIFIGFTLSKRVNGEKLKPAFGWLVLAMGIYILVREILPAL
ncbi:sulfite exporter TauE/SafE family protein [Chitinophaga sp.]|uniref:sulfite exporter TauE/SafE family protein n=1 Tax=Chitinophaga sp. TaxID=1869181 RepID=UPI0031E3ED85